MPREKFRCFDCGLRVEGRLNPVTLQIVAYERSGSDPDAPVRDMLCVRCYERTRPQSST
jgi:hypothetical protein